MNKSPIQNEDIVKLVKKRKLTGKQRAFITEYIKNGKNGVQAALKVYNANSYNVAAAVSSENLNKPNIKEAIEKALEKADATPEKAVENVWNVANQTEVNPGHALNANKLILQLHGWKEGERPNTTLNIKNAFFNKHRGNAHNDTTIEGEIVQ